MSAMELGVVVWLTDRGVGIADLAPAVEHLGSTVERGFWVVDGMMVQVSGFRLAANHEIA